MISFRESLTLDPFVARLQIRHVPGERGRMCDRRSVAKGGQETLHYGANGLVYRPLFFDLCLPDTAFTRSSVIRDSSC